VSWEGGWSASRTADRADVLLARGDRGAQQRDGI
jgi:hypothetical protein